GLVYLDTNYVVQWRSLQLFGRILGNNAYEPGEYCYKTVYGRDAVCEDCPMRQMLISQQGESNTIQRNNNILEISANPVFDHQNKLIGGVLRLEDVTERIKKDNQIKRLNDLMDAILNNIPVHLFVKDPNDDFRYLYWNKAIADNTKIPTSEVLGKKDEEIFSRKEDILRFKNGDILLLNSRKNMDVIEEYHAVDGTKRIASTFKTSIPSDNGKLPLILGISWDITDLKNAEKELIVAKEKAEESNRLKSAFLANMSHEIRTPLNAIVGFSDLLVETVSVSEKQEYIGIIKKNNELLLQLISDILDLSKIEAQTLEFVFETTDVNSLCNSVVASGNLRVDAKVPIIFENKIPECYIYTDKNRINQVLSNLVTNALKFTSEGDIRVGYHIVDDSTIRFYVKDSGIGIKKEQLDSIFERFIKLNHFAQGTGLGLPICKNIVEQLNGSIGVESEWGSGSCFWFTLPYDKELKKETTTKSKNKVPEFLKSSRTKKILPGNRKLNVLVAEDIDSNFLLINDTFKEKYNIIRAVNGKEAIEKYKSLSPDIILMDIKMPDMDGLEATREIRRMNPLIPIIAVTAYAYDTDIKSAEDAGCNSFLTKPISVTDLQEAIEEYIG
ncbi:response regulator, partial [Bacteroides sp. OttesenSCG-928-J23]|nr:response regulator [Bacteroides sp. OttesenSCG-928-J23]